MASSISAARAALFAKLDAHADLAAPQVTFGAPDAHEEQEVVALLGVRIPDEDAAALGGGRKDETYELVVRVKVHQPAGTAPETDARGFALADAVADAIEGDGDYTLNGTVMWAYVTSTTTDGAVAAQGGGWVIFLDVVVTCVARIDRRSA